MADFPESLLDAGEQEGIRTVALALVRDVVTERDRLAAAPDDEALHDFRVAVRRLRSWLRAHREALGRSAAKPALRALRKVAQATGAGRDAEVLAEWVEETKSKLPARQRAGAAWLLKEVGAERQSAEAVLDGEIATSLTRAVESLEERLPLYRVTHHLHNGARELPFAAAMAAAIRSHAVTFRRRRERVQDAADDAVHRARIAGKRLRYLIEPVAPHVVGGQECVDRLKRLQDTLGDLHDAHVWLGDLRRRFERHGAEEARRLSQVTLLETEELPVAPDIRPGLMTLTTALRARVKERYATFTTEWSPEATGDFLAQVERIASTLDHRGLGGVEIERKFLLYALPQSLPEGDVWLVEQGYVPGERLVERLRRVRDAHGDRFFRTVKAGTGLARLELEEETAREVFEAMWPLTAGRRVTKRRHRIPDGDVTWEIDEFTDRDLVLAEVELRRADQQVAVPEWLESAVVRDVTGEPEYLNVNLAR